MHDVAEPKQFAGVDRRRKAPAEGESHEISELAVFHELGKALTC
jgi:hypothetical protein